MYGAALGGRTFDITASATDPDGTVFTEQLLVPSWSGSDLVHIYEGGSGAFLGTMAPFADGLDDHIEVILGPNGNLFVSSEQSDSVLEYQTDGTLVGTFVAPGSGGLNASAGMDFGPDGNLYVASYGSGDIFRYDGTTGAYIDTFVPVGTGGLATPLGLNFGPDGMLYVASRGANNILRFDATTGAHDATFNGDMNGGVPENFTFAPNGNILAADLWNGRVVEIDATTGTYLGDFVAVNAGGLQTPAGLAFGPDGHLYVGDQGTHSIKKYDGVTGASLGDYVTSGSGGLVNPAYFTFVANQQVEVLAPAAPVLDLDADDSAAAGIDFAATWTQGGGPVSVADSDASLSDSDSANLTSLTVTISNHWDGADEVLTADTTGTSITASYDSATGVLTLSGADTVASYQQVLRTITYDNTHWAPYGETRTLDFVASDGTNSSSVATTTLSMATDFGVLIVTNTTDTVNGDTSSISNLIASQGGDGISLREAIEATNSTANGTGPDVIRFDVAGPGPHVIAVDPAGLPPISQPLIIDGTSEPDFAGTPMVVLDGTGTNAGVDGLEITGDDSTVRGLVIQNFAGAGIYLNGGSGNVIEGNYIGTDLTGTGAAANGTFGIEIINSSGNTIGGTTAGAGNVISGNTDDGISFWGASATGSFVQGNLIGTTADGLAALANGSNGIKISGNASGNTIGGTSEAERNVISGNADDGIELGAADGNVISGNYIGVDANGTARLGNGRHGVVLWSAASNTTIGGTANGAGNVISDNAIGIVIDGNGGSTVTGTVVQGNLVGTDKDGVADLGNSSHGIHVFDGASDSLIGGSLAGADNTIAFNGGDGIAIVDATTTGNTILGNRITDNAGLAIDLGNDGVSGNDPAVNLDSDSGPNDLQNFPVMWVADVTGSDIHIVGQIDSAASTAYRIEFYNNPLGTEDGTGHGEGRVLLGFLDVTTDASGNASIDTVLNGVTVANGDRISATATVITNAGLIGTDELAAFGSTSEFSLNMPATVIGNPPVLDLDADDSKTPGLDFGAIWSEGAGPVTLADTDASLTDADSANLESLTVTITNRFDGVAEILAADTTGTSITASYDSATGVLTLSGTDTVANYQQVLRTVAYDNTSEVTDATARVVTFVAFDGTASSAVAQTTVGIMALNDAPVNATLATQGTDTDVELVFSSATGNAISISDADSAANDTLEVTLSVSNGTLSLAEAYALDDQVRVNTTTADVQEFAAIDSTASGAYVVVWETQHTGSRDVYAQLYDADGNAVGGEFQVSAAAADSQFDPTVAMNDAGQFVVAWRDNRGADTDVYVRVFDATGTPTTGDILVNTTQLGNDTEPDIAIDDAGNFVVIWQGDAGASEEIRGQRFDASGAQVGGEFQVNTTTVDQQDDPSVAMAGDGRFVVVWESYLQDGSGEGVYAQLYDATGATVGGEFMVNTTTSGSQNQPDVAMDDAGNFTVVWQSKDADLAGIFFQRFDASGAQIGGEVQANTEEWLAQGEPVISMNDAGEFTIAWQSELQDGSGLAVYARRFDATGVAQGGEVPLSTETVGNQFRAAITMHDTGFIAAWEGTGGGDDSSIFVRRYDKVDVTFVTGDGVEDATLTIQGTQADLNGVLDGLVYRPNTGYVGYDTLVVTTDDLGNTGALGALQDVDNVLIAVGTPAIEIIATSPISAVGAETLVNATVAGAQELPASASDDDGNTIVVWQSLNQDGSFYGIYAQRYDANGSPVGGELLVNTTTLDVQDQPAVAMAADGRFVITWTSENQDGSGSGVYGQLFDATGATVGGEFQVNETTTGAQDASAVAMADDGSFVVVWQSEGVDADGLAIVGRSFGADGVALGGEFDVNDYETGNQGGARIAMDAVGNFVVSWTSVGQDGSGTGIYAQRFDRTAEPRGPEIAVTTETLNDQRDSSIAMAADGSFVIVWRSDVQDGSSGGVYGQRFAADGTALGGEFQINTTTVNDQFAPEVAMNDAGDFVVTWASQVQDGSDAAVVMRGYAADGTATSAEVVVNTTTLNQASPCRPSQWTPWAGSPSPGRATSRTATPAASTPSASPRTTDEAGRAGDFRRRALRSAHRRRDDHARTQRRHRGRALDDVAHLHDGELEHAADDHGHGASPMASRTATSATRSSRTPRPASTRAMRR